MTGRSDATTKSGFVNRDMRCTARYISSALLFALALLVAPLALSAPASADLRLCNKTDAQVGVAVGYKSDENWVSEGWWNLPAQSCEVLLEGRLSARYYYLYALDYAQGGEWSGQAFMCTREKEFTITGIEDCLARGYERTGFVEIDTGEQASWTVHLTERTRSGIGGR
ncbi:DUF1036 domain-containing protein [Amorphus orientalis]|uniref:Membrane protein n=1 Tax=Amorphus orientalis TaxID=649198 RepID=A0AAE3VQ92_9HYPH|nr:DUF1036 domain-containing protein [Amorphus orientalis]MDQ0316809.1 putative membrane protein [Amorphus orientalis]